MNVVRYSEQYVEGTAEQVDSGIVGLMLCVTENIMWKILHSRWTVVSWVEYSVLHWIIMWKLLHSRWTVVLWVECSVLHWTVCGRYCTSGGQWCCVLNVVSYIEHNVEGTAQQVDSGIVAWMDCVTMNIMWKILHSRWAVLLWLEWSVLMWTLCGIYCTAGGQCYCGLNGIYFSEHYEEETAQQEECDIAAWKDYVIVNFKWNLLFSDCSKTLFKAI